MISTCLQLPEDNDREKDEERGRKGDKEQEGKMEEGERKRGTPFFSVTPAVQSNTSSRVSRDQIL